MWGRHLVCRFRRHPAAPNTGPGCPVNRQAVSLTHISRPALTTCPPGANDRERIHSASGSGINRASCNELLQGSCQPSCRIKTRPRVLKQDTSCPVSPESGRQAPSILKKPTGKCLKHSGSGLKLPAFLMKLPFTRQKLSAPLLKQPSKRKKHPFFRLKHPETGQKQSPSGEKRSENQKFMLQACR